MRRMALRSALIGSSAAVGLCAQALAAPSLDVVGIGLGMSAKEAMAALKIANPRLMPTPTTYSLEGFTKPLALSVAGQEAVSAGPDSTVARAGEAIEILFTTPPNPPVVWGVKRVYNFATKERPTLEVALEALRKKYGVESVPRSQDQRAQARYLAWVYDARGNPIGEAGEALNMKCAGMFNAHFGGDIATINEIQSGRPGPAECQSIIVVNANLLASPLDPASPQLVVDSLIVHINDGSRHRAATDATRAVVLRAADERAGKQAEEAQQRAAPKL